MSSPGPASKRQLAGRAFSIGLSTFPFAFAFGAACTQSGLSVWEALGFSALVFGGSAQFAAVGVLADGGAVVAAILAGGLLTLRSLAFGILLAPALRGPVWWRALVSLWMIDESTAVAVSTDDPALRRYGYLAGGLSVYLFFNAGTLAGSLLIDGGGSVIDQWGLDATIPAAFLALLWPRLSDPSQRRAVVAGLIIAAALTPFTPPGIPIVAAALGALAGGARSRPLRRRPQG